LILISAMRDRFPTFQLPATLLLLLFCHINLYASRSWVWQNPIPQGNNINSIRFAPDKLRGWAVGAEGVILHTTDGGFSWELQNSPVGTTLYALSITGKNRVCAVGARGVVLTTDNGGERWSIRQTAVREHLYSVSFSEEDQDFGWVAGTHGTILKTEDGGISWTTQISGVSTHILSISFYSKRSGVAAGEQSTILTTSDGGETWTPIKEESFNRVEHLQASYTASKLQPLTSAAMLQNDIAVVSGFGGRVYRSTDGGKSWSAVDTYAKTDLLSLYFIDSKQGWAVGNDGLVLSTGDGGSTWLPMSIKTRPRLSAVYFVDKHTGWALNGED
jgi:photosystem II stability/assembly factor-like uncharacterized protein